MDFIMISLAIVIQIATEVLVMEVADAVAIVAAKDATLTFNVKYAINLGILLRCVVSCMIKEINLIHPFIFKILQVRAIFNIFNIFRIIMYNGANSGNNNQAHNNQSKGQSN